jgi:hypothetical protein
MGVTRVKLEHSPACRSEGMKKIYTELLHLQQDLRKIQQNTNIPHFTVSVETGVKFGKTLTKRTDPVCYVVSVIVPNRPDFGDPKNPKVGFFCVFVQYTVTL